MQRWTKLYEKNNFFIFVQTTFAFSNYLFLEPNSLKDKKDQYYDSE